MNRNPPFTLSHDLLNLQIYIMDIHIWYTLLSAIYGAVMGARARLGEVLISVCFNCFIPAYN